MKDFQVSDSIEFVLYTLKKGKKSSLWQILTPIYDKLPRPEINQCPLVEACQSETLFLSCPVCLQSLLGSSWRSLEFWSPVLELKLSDGETWQCICKYNFKGFMQLSLFERAINQLETLFFADQCVFRFFLVLAGASSHFDWPINTIPSFVSPVVIINSLSEVISVRRKCGYYFSSAASCGAISLGQPL